MREPARTPSTAPDHQPHRVEIRAEAHYADNSQEASKIPDEESGTESTCSGGSFDSQRYRKLLEADWTFNNRIREQLIRGRREISTEQGMSSTEEVEIWLRRTNRQSGGDIPAKNASYFQVQSQGTLPAIGRDTSTESSGLDGLTLSRAELKDDIWAKTERNTVRQGRKANEDGEIFVHSARDATNMRNASFRSQSVPALLVKRSRVSPSEVIGRDSGENCLGSGTGVSSLSTDHRTTFANLSNRDLAKFAPP